MRPNPEFLSEGSTLSMPSSLDVQLFREAPHYWAHRELFRLRTSLLAMAQYGWMLKAEEWEAVRGSSGAARRELEEMDGVGRAFRLHGLGETLREAPTFAASLRSVVVGTSAKEWIVYREKHGLVTTLLAMTQNPPLVMARLKQVANEMERGDEGTGSGRYHSISTWPVYDNLHRRAEAELSVKLPRMFGEPGSSGAHSIPPPPVLVAQRGSRFDFERAVRETAWGYGVLLASREAWSLAGLQGFKKNFPFSLWSQATETWLLAQLRETATAEAVKRSGSKGKGLVVAKMVSRATEVIFAAMPAMMRAGFWAHDLDLRAGQQASIVAHYRPALEAVEKVRQRSGEPVLPRGWPDEDWMAGKAEAVEALVAAKVYQP